MTINQIQDQSNPGNYDQQCLFVQFQNIRRKRQKPQWHQKRRRVNQPADCLGEKRLRRRDK